jgi:hypothetical protein
MDHTTKSSSASLPVEAANRKIPIRSSGMCGVHGGGGGASVWDWTARRAGMSYDGEAGMLSAGEGDWRGPRLRKQIRGRLRVKRYGLCTRQAWLCWIRRYTRDELPRHPDERGTGGVLSPLDR